VRPGAVAGRTVREGIASLDMKPLLVVQILVQAI
jgi:hypothetical protein